MDRLLQEGMKSLKQAPRRRKSPHRHGHAHGHGHTGRAMTRHFHHIMARRLMGAPRSPYATAVIPMGPEEEAAAALFDQFCAANTFQTTMASFYQLCDLLQLKPQDHQIFYKQLKMRLTSWKAQSLWSKLDKRASQREYKKGTACSNTQVLIIGSGPCGLRSAIEVALLGGKAVVVEKRESFSRNNVLHLWPFLIHDLKALGAKKFFGKFCAGSIDHISIRTLQCILLKVALLVGVEIHAGVAFEGLAEPSPLDASERLGWRAKVSPSDHPVSQYEFDVLIGADGKRNTLTGFCRKEFRGKLAIAITANFINRNSQQEARVEEISGVAYIFNQKFFKDLNVKTGIDLENIVYYKDETHYFVMTAKKHSLLNKGVLMRDYEDPERLLAQSNVDQKALLTYAREAADVSTNYLLPSLDFAHNHYGQPDVAMFDFTSMFAAEHASRVVEKHGYKLLLTLVGDSLLEPFWPTGSGCARGFLGAFDAAWMVRNWASCKLTPLEVMAERESVYQMLSQTTPENINKNFSQHTIDPNTRYPNCNSSFFKPQQMRRLYEGGSVANLDHMVNISEERSKKYECLRDSHYLLKWFQRQLEPYRQQCKILDLTTSWRNGLALAALIHKYRPELIDVYALDPNQVAENNQRVFDLAKKEFGIEPITTGHDMECYETPDKVSMIAYLKQFYEYFSKEAIRRARRADWLYDVVLSVLKQTEEKKIVKSPTPGHRHLHPKSPALHRQSYGIPGKHSNKGKPSKWQSSSSSTDGESPGDGDDVFFRDNSTKRLNTYNKPLVNSGITSQRIKDLTNPTPEDDLSRQISDVKDLEKLRLQKELKAMQAGRKGHVSSLAKHLEIPLVAPQAPVPDLSENPSDSKTSSELCFFCGKKVYLVERYTAEGLYFHRGCFRCHYCCTAIRIGGHAFVRDQDGGGKFYCKQHVGLVRPVSRKLRRRSRGSKDLTDYVTPSTPPSQPPLMESDVVQMKRTPERVEYCTESEMEESELDQTAHNLSASILDLASGIDASDSADSSDDDMDWSDGELSDADVSWADLAKSYSRKLERKEAAAARGDTGSDEADDESGTETETAEEDEDWETETEVESDSEEEYSDESSDEATTPAEEQPKLTACERLGFTPPSKPVVKEAQPSQSSAALSKNRLAFFSAVSEPVRIDAHSFLGIRPIPPPEPEPVNDEVVDEAKDEEESVTETESRDESSEVSAAASVPGIALKEASSSSELEEEVSLSEGEEPFLSSMSEEEERVYSAGLTDKLVVNGQEADVDQWSSGEDSDLLESSDEELRKEATMSSEIGSESLTSEEVIDDTRLTSADADEEMKQENGEDRTPSEVTTAVSANIDTDEELKPAETEKPDVLSEIPHQPAVLTDNKTVDFVNRGDLIREESFANLVSSNVLTSEASVDDLSELTEANKEEGFGLTTTDLMESYVALEKSLLGEEVKLAVAAVEVKPAVAAVEEKPAVLAEKGNPAVLAEEEKPAVLAEEEKPAVSDEEEKPAASNEKDKPAVSAQEEKPAVSAEEKPAVSDEEKPAVSAEEKPAVSAEEKPAVLAEGDKQVVLADSESGSSQRRQLAGAMTLPGLGIGKELMEEMVREVVMETLSEMKSESQTAGNAAETERRQSFSDEIISEKADVSSPSAAEAGLQNDDAGVISQHPADICVDDSSQSVMTVDDEHAVKPAQPQQDSAIHIIEHGDRRKDLIHQESFASLVSRNVLTSEASVDDLSELTEANKEESFGLSTTDLILANVTQDVAAAEVDVVEADVVDVCQAEQDEVFPPSDVIVAENTNMSAKLDRVLPEQDTVLSDLKAVSSKQEMLSVEEDAVSAEQNATSAEQDTASAEQDTASAEQDAASTEQEAASAEQDAASAEQDMASAEQDMASAEQDAALAVQDAASAEQNTVAASEISVSHELDTLSSKQDSVTSGQDDECEEQTAEAAQKHVLSSEKDSISVEKDKASVESYDESIEMEKVSFELDAVSSDKDTLSDEQNSVLPEHSGESASLQQVLEQEKQEVFVADKMQYSHEESFANLVSRNVLTSEASFDDLSELTEANKEGSFGLSTTDLIMANVTQEESSVLEEETTQQADMSQQLEVTSQLAGIKSQKEIISLQEEVTIPQVTSQQEVTSLQEVTSQQEVSSQQEVTSQQLIANEVSPSQEVASQQVTVSPEHDEDTDPVVSPSSPSSIFSGSSPVERVPPFRKTSATVAPRAASESLSDDISQGSLDKSPDSSGFSEKPKLSDMATVNVDVSSSQGGTQLEAGLDSATSVKDVDKKETESSILGKFLKLSDRSQSSEPAKGASSVMEKDCSNDVNISLAGAEGVKPDDVLSRRRQLTSAMTLPGLGIGKELMEEMVREVVMETLTEMQEIGKIKPSSEIPSDGISRSSSTIPDVSKDAALLDGVEVSEEQIVSGPSSSLADKPEMHVSQDGAADQHSVHVKQVEGVKKSDLIREESFANLVSRNILTSEANVDDLSELTEANKEKSFGLSTTDLMESNLTTDSSVNHSVDATVSELKEKPSYQSVSSLSSAQSEPVADSSQSHHEESPKLKASLSLLTEDQDAIGRDLNLTNLVSCNLHSQSSAADISDLVAENEGLVAADDSIFMTGVPRVLPGESSRETNLPLNGTCPESESVQHVDITGPVDKSILKTEREAESLDLIGTVSRETSTGCHGEAEADKTEEEALKRIDALILNPNGVVSEKKDECELRTSDAVIRDDDDDDILQDLLAAVKAPVSNKARESEDDEEKVKSANEIPPQVSEVATDIASGEDGNHLVEYSFSDESGSHSFVVDEKFVTTRKKQAARDDDINGGLCPAASTPTVSVDSSDLISDLGITSPIAPFSLAEESVSTSTPLTSTSQKTGNSLDDLVATNMLDNEPKVRLEADSDVPVTGVESTLMVSAESSLANGSVYFTPPTAPVSDTREEASKNDADSKTVNSLTLSIASSTTENPDQRSISSWKTDSSQDSPQVYSPSTLVDAKRRFFFETSQPVRIDPKKVFKSLNRPKKMVATEINEKEFMNGDSVFDTGKVDVLTAAVPRSNSASGDKEDLYSSASKTEDEFKKPSDKKRFLPTTPAGKSNVDLSKKTLTSDEIKLIKSVEQSQMKKEARERARKMSDKELGISSSAVPRKASVKGERPKSEILRDKNNKTTERPTSVKSGTSSSSTISSNKSSPRILPKSLLSDGSASDASPNTSRKNKKDKSKTKSKFDKSKTKEKSEKENSESPVPDDKRDKRRSLFSMFLSKSQDKREKRAKSPPPPQEARAKSPLFFSTKSPPTDPKSSKSPEQRPASAGKRLGARLRSKSAKREAEEKRRSMLDEMTSLQVQAEEQKKARDSMKERLQAVAPAPSKSLLAPKASLEEFELDDDDKVSLRSFQMQAGLSDDDMARLLKRQQKAAARRHKEQELKRLRMAQEIQRSLEEVEQRQREVEAQGIKVEQQLRQETNTSAAKQDESPLIQQWFNIVHEKNVLVRYESELMIHAKELELEDRHSRLESRLRAVMAIPEEVKSFEESEEEQMIMSEMLEVVEQRDALVTLLEEHRLRCKDADQGLKDMMSAKGYELSPIPHNMRLRVSSLRPIDLEAS